MLEIKIEHVGLGSIDILAGLKQLDDNEYFPRFLPESDEGPIEHDEAMKRIKRICGNPRNSLYAVFHEGDVIGYICMRECEQRMQRIESVFTHPDFRRNGVGKAMVDHCVYGALLQGCRGVSMVINKDNREIIALLEACGFIPERGGFYTKVLYSSSDKLR